MKKLQELPAAAKPLLPSTQLLSHIRCLRLLEFARAIARATGGKMRTTRASRGATARTFLAMPPKKIASKLQKPRQKPRRKPRRKPGRRPRKMHPQAALPSSPSLRVSRMPCTALGFFRRNAKILSLQLSRQVRASNRHQLPGTSQLIEPCCFPRCPMPNSSDVGLPRSRKCVA